MGVLSRGATRCPRLLHRHLATRELRLARPGAVRHKLSHATESIRPILLQFERVSGRLLGTFIIQRINALHRKYNRPGVRLRERAGGDRRAADLPDEN